MGLSAPVGRFATSVPCSSTRPARGRSDHQVAIQPSPYNSSNQCRPRPGRSTGVRPYAGRTNATNVCAGRESGASADWNDRTVSSSSPGTGRVTDPSATTHSGTNTVSVRCAGAAIIVEPHAVGEPTGDAVGRGATLPVSLHMRPATVLVLPGECSPISSRGRRRGATVIMIHRRQTLRSAVVVEGMVGEPFTPFGGRDPASATDRGGRRAGRAPSAITPTSCRTGRNRRAALALPR